MVMMMMAMDIVVEMWRTIYAHHNSNRGGGGVGGGCVNHNER